MAEIICMANQKGGVAKTTSTFYVGKCLAAKGLKTLMIDLDPQASLTICSGFEPYDYERSIVTVMADEKSDVGSCIIRTADGLPDLIPSRIDLAQLELDIISRSLRETILKRALAKIEAMYDYILIDCAPQLGMLSINAFCSADWVVVPVSTDYMAYRGIEYFSATIESVQEFTNPALKVLGVIATLHDARVKDDREVLAALRERYNVIGVVKRLSAGKKAAYDGLSGFDMRASNPVLNEYKYITDCILDNIRAARTQ